MHRQTPCLAAIVCAACFAACSSAPRDDVRQLDDPALRPVQSGFLGDYSNLKPSPTHPGSYYEQSPELRSYRRFMVDPVQVLAKKTARGAVIDDRTARDLAESLRAELAAAAGRNGTVVDAPGEGVARIRAAITSIARSRGSGDTVGTSQLGGASAEIEIVDSITRQRLGAAIEADTVDVFESAGGPRPDYADAKLVFQHWSARLNLWLSGLAGESPAR